MIKLISLAVSFVLAAFGAAAQAGKTEVLWLGQAAFKITSPGGKVIVTDPWLRANPRTPAQYKDLAALGKGTPQEFMQALGNTATKVLPLAPGEKAEF